MVNELNTVFEYLREQIADSLDVNRTHIRIIAVLDEKHKKRTGKDSEKERIVKFINDKEPEKERTAVWTEYKYFNGELFERIEIVDQDQTDF